MSPEQVIEVAERLYWVGGSFADDPFQCHAYLLEHGEESVLFDPGSNLTIDTTLAKIRSIVPLDHVKWFVCHHQDPDIVAAMPRIDALVRRPDARVVTHWRAEVLLKHLGLEMPFWRVEDHDWALELSERRLEFVFTPYLHFPGAFGTFDRATGTLLSSDLFGGFSSRPSLFAEAREDLEGVIRFHEHYMPSREVLGHTLGRLRKLPIQQIAPQHGHVLRGSLVDEAFSRLSGLDCGLYLLAEKDSEVARLLELSRTLQSTLKSLVLERDFKVFAAQLLEQVQHVLPAVAVEFVCDPANGDGMLHFAPESRYRGVERACPDALRSWASTAPAGAILDLPDDAGLGGGPGPRVWMRLGTTQESSCGVAVIRLESPRSPSTELDAVLHRLAEPLAVALEREALRRAIEAERDTLRELSVKDPLTGLFTRRYLDTEVPRVLARVDRGVSPGVACAMFDIDHFKSVNDGFGHPAGDVVLARVAERLRAESRDIDHAVRYGGEEFAWVMEVPSVELAVQAAERVRASIEALRFESGHLPEKVTISAGVALRQPGESLSALIARADRALYEAKRSGRNRVCVASAE
jgi:diguanylate cyclase (GGDEF)-like protein